MPPLACVSLPELPLQLVIRAHPEWRSLPVVVLTEDRPTGIVLHANRAAVRAGVRRSHRYASALTLCSTLRAGVVRDREIDEGLDSIARRLLRFTPRVERCDLALARSTGSGIFWLDARGLGFLFPTITQWLMEIERDIEALGFRPRLAAGFTRGGTLVAARSSVRADDPGSSQDIDRGPSRVIFPTREAELYACRDAPLRTLPLGQTARSRLGALGIRNVQDFLDLPIGGVRMRLGHEAERLHVLLSAPSTLPLQPLEEREDLVIRKRFEREITDTPTLLDFLVQGLETMVRDTKRVDTRIRVLMLSLTMEDGSLWEECIRPSEPTSALDRLRGLLRLRVESLFTPERKRRVGVIGFALSAERCRGSSGQVHLMGLDPSVKRDREAGERAFALIRAELGNDSIRRVRLRFEHPPESQYEWVCCPSIAPRGAGQQPGVRTEEGRGERPARPPASGNALGAPMLVRRIHESRTPLRMTGGAHRGKQGSPAGREGGGTAGGARGCGGPYVLSGAWWSAPFDRVYRFIETPDGAMLWIFRDRTRDQDGTTWMLQGLVG